MPLFKAGQKLIFYAHVPKCGGSAVARYLSERFGAVAFNDTKFTDHDPRSIWSKTSPQHIDAQSLSRLFPEDFFDAVFTIVRHPIPRLVSAYHFQIEVEKSVSAQVLFSDWLADIAEMREENPFLYDNHVRPMAEIVPKGAQVFHMEHGIDGLIPWCDMVTGGKDGPRAIPKVNEKGAYSKASADRVEPSASDIAMIAKLYAADFERFGYDPATPRDCAAPAPALSEEFEAERDAELQRLANPLNKLRTKIGSKLGL